MDHARFRLRYQRIEPLTPGLPVKVELLLGMLDDDGRLLMPGEFIATAEQFDMMPEMDRCVVRKAMALACAPPRELADVDQFGVNLSGQSVNDPTFLDDVIAIMRETGVDPRCLCFEITESAVISHMAQAQNLIRTLRGFGVRFALDDFGSGLSSFGYLRALDVDELKIDGQFVRHLAHDEVDQSMVRCINQVGHTMGMRTVAEFVEDDAILEQVRSLGLDYAQGHALHAAALAPEPEPLGCAEVQ